MCRTINKGFTLIELLVVISIIGILSSVVLVAVNSQRVRANEVKYIQELAELGKAIAVYRSNTGDIPGGAGYIGSDQNGDSGFDDLLAPLVSAKVLAKIPHYYDWKSGVTSPSGIYQVYRKNDPNGEDPSGLNYACGTHADLFAIKATGTQGVILIYGATKKFAPYSTASVAAINPSNPSQNTLASPINPNAQCIPL